MTTKLALAVLPAAATGSAPKAATYTTPPRVGEKPCHRTTGRHRARPKHTEHTRDETRTASAVAAAQQRINDVGAGGDLDGAAAHSEIDAYRLWTRRGRAVETRRGEPFYGFAEMSGGRSSDEFTLRYPSRPRRPSRCPRLRVADVGHLEVHGRKQ